MNIVQEALALGGQLSALVIPQGLKYETGLMNPSVFVDEDNDILVNLRHVNSISLYSENEQMFSTRRGPLSFVYPEKDQRLDTVNYLCRLDKELNLINQAKVDTSRFDVEPLWFYSGVEDCRLVQWNGKYYLIGVRRDTTTNGVGRMEYSEIEIDKSSWTVTEVMRARIPNPGNDSSYCEKNWVPVLDRPYHFIKWASPVELVAAYPHEIKSDLLFVRQGCVPPKEQRGSSQVIRWGNIQLSITHEVVHISNYLGQRDARYQHRLLVWDDQLNLVGVSKPFTFFEGSVEFVAGAARLDEDLLISFGFQDNSAFILRTPKDVVENLIIEALAYEI